MTTKIYITWDEFHSDTRTLCAKIKNSGTYNKIVAVSRGGLLPAGILAYELEIRDNAVINMSSYDGQTQRDEKDFEIAGNVGLVDEQTLIVDDLSDSGSTYKKLRPLFPKAKFVTVYAKPQGQSAVDIFAKEIPDQWVVFPWD